MKEIDYTKPLSFEEIKPVLYKICHKYVKKFFNKYEVDELVNEVWLKGRVQKATSFKHLCLRIRWDVLEYIRDDMGGRVVCVARWKVLNPLSYDQEISDRNSSSIEGKKNLYKEYLLYDDLGQQNIDSEDWFNVLLCVCNRREKLIIKLKYMYNYTNLEIGKVINLTESRVFQLVKQTNVILKEHILLKGL